MGVGTPRAGGHDHSHWTSAWTTAARYALWQANELAADFQCHRQRATGSPCSPCSPCWCPSSSSSCWWWWIQDTFDLFSCDAIYARTSCEAGGAGEAQVSCLPRNCQLPASASASACACCRRNNPWLHCLSLPAEVK